MAESQAKGARVENKVEEVFRDESARFKVFAQFFQETSRQSLAFVNLTASSGATQDLAKRKQVRSHVMHNFQQKKQMQEYGEWQV